jgi:hydroxylysine kinase
MSDRVRTDLRPLSTKPGSPLAIAEAMLRTPPPAVTESDALAILHQHYGLRARVRLLAGERDRNFAIEDDTGRRSVLKIYNSSDGAEIRAMQHGALGHIHARAPDCPVPQILPTRTGDEEALIRHGGKTVAAVVISRLPGENPTSRDLTPALRRELGRVVGRLGRALADFRHPGAERIILWDMMHVARLRPLADLIDRPARRAAVLAWLDHFAAVTHPAASALPQQPIHNDLSLSNLLVDPDTRSNVVGVIDFGDIVHAPRINELAIAASYFLSPLDEPAQAIADILRGAAANLHLTTAEIAAMPALIRARLATRILLSGWRARLFPDNRDYILRSNRAAWLIWDRLQASPADLPARLVDLCAGARPG